MRTLVCSAAVLLLGSLAVSAHHDDAPAGAPVRLEIALDKAEYPFRGAIALTVTYTNVSKGDVVLWANGRAPGEGFPGETFEITSGAGRKTYTIVGVEPQVDKVTIKPGESWKRTIKDLAPTLSTGVVIDSKAPRDTDALPDPFGQLDDFTIRLSFQSAVKNQAKPALNGRVESNTLKFKVRLQ
ncbi:hypothetical protein [Frigoriglobus tundricola]|uniref:Uncharacterized protein n=1 Tax=Frigoriglobus tundricola TaxID=2774151 RepID=A0A6M5YVK0_9BACT|nr:hypothetical protein [Frigoriglobus tundricola]QJW96932.1 hypothetical protein FTUN_4492 [Frigoriglobus tundricola]